MKITRRPNLHLRKIVLEETNDGRDIVRYLKSVITTIEGAPELYGLRHKDYARSHKIAAARILARLGLEDGKRYLRRNYVPSPFRRVHPEEEDGPKTDMAASTAQLYRLVKKETNDGKDIIIRFVEIMKGYHKEYKPHLRMAAAKELIRQIEFDYEEEPTSPPPTHTESTHEPVREDTQTSAHQDNQTNHSSDDGSSESSESNSDSQPANPVHPTHPVNPDSEKEPDTNQPNPVYPTYPVNPDSDKITAHHPNHKNHSSDPYRQYTAQHCAPEEESIYQSIIRRAAHRPDLESAKLQAEELIGEFNQFALERNPDFDPVSVPTDLLARSLTQRMGGSNTHIFDPADYYDLDRDQFYFCQCQDCDECDEYEFFIEFMRELEEETDYLFEDP